MRINTAPQILPWALASAKAAARTTAATTTSASATASASAGASRLGALIFLNLRMNRTHRHNMNVRL